MQEGMDSSPSDSYATRRCDATCTALSLVDKLDPHDPLLQGDPTYLVTGSDGASLVNYGINAVCTHLGCVVPWVPVSVVQLLSAVQSSDVWGQYRLQTDSYRQLHFDRWAEAKEDNMILTCCSGGLQNGGDLMDEFRCPCMMCTRFQPCPETSVIISYLHAGQALCLHRFVSKILWRGTSMSWGSAVVGALAVDPH
eukprot:scaffold35179_cov36-Tisochrysis_lutea.AAC.4